MQDIVQKRVTQLGCKYQAYLNNLKASLACVAVAFFSILPITSAQVSLVESLPSRIQHPSVEAKLLFFLFICAVYATATACPILLGFHFFSGITISALILSSILTALILYVLDMAEFGGSIFFLFVGIVIGWFGEVAWAICIIFIYSFWRNKSYFVVLLICSLAITSSADQLANLPPKSGFDVLSTTCLSSFFVLFVSTSIARKALQEVPPFTWLKDHAIALSAIGGISFNKLEIKNLSFEGVDLSHVDFRGSKIHRTSFRGARNLKFSCVKGTILDDPKVRGLLAMPKTAQVSDKKFRNANLAGADLSDLDLEGIDFSGANLTNVDFSNTNLAGANLTNTQLFNATFSGARLDEICICDWAINKETCFDNVKCNWVYLRQSKYGPREKKPDIGEFQVGEFEKWIRRLQDTVDLILREQPNVRALVAAIERVAHSYDGLDPSRFSIESKGDNLYIAKIETTPEADKTELAKTIIFNYNLINELMIQGESNRLFLAPGGGYMETHNQNINAGNNVDMSSGTRVNVGGDITGSSITLGDLNGQVSNVIQSIQDIEGDNQSLAKILEALQSAINNDQALSESQKLQAMEAVATLAEESQKPKEQRLPKICSMAMNALKGITSTLTDASKLADLLKTHLPTLIKLLGL